MVARCQPAPPLRGLLPLAFAKLFLDQAVPTGGISGTALVVRGLERRRVPTPLAIAAVVVDLLGYYVAYALGVAATLVILARHGRLETPLLVLVATFALVAVAMVVALLWLTLRDSPPAWARRFRPGQRLRGAFAAAPAALVRDPRLLAQGAVLRGAVFLLDAATLAMMLRAIGQPAPAGAVIAAFLMGSVAATVGPLPAGVGTFEAGAAATLGLLGIPAAAALTATLLLRAVTFWLPMLPGFLLSRREVSGPAAGAAPGRAALGPADPAPPG